MSRMCDVRVSTDKCREKQCDYYSACIVDSHGTATCICPSASSCPQVRQLTLLCSRSIGVCTCTHLSQKNNSFDFHAEHLLFKWGQIHFHCSFDSDGQYL